MIFPPTFAEFEHQIYADSIHFMENRENIRDAMSAMDKYEHEPSTTLQQQKLIVEMKAVMEHRYDELEPEDERKARIQKNFDSERPPIECESHCGFDVVKINRKNETIELLAQNSGCSYDFIHVFDPKPKVVEEQQHNNENKIDSRILSLYDGRLLRCTKRNASENRPCVDDRKFMLSSSGDHSYDAITEQIAKNYVIENWGDHEGGWKLCCQAEWKSESLVLVNASYHAEMDSHMVLLFVHVPSGRVVYHLEDRDMMLQCGDCRTWYCELRDESSLLVWNTGDVSSVIVFHRC
jgi:hypothetical protein